MALVLFQIMFHLCKPKTGGCQLNAQVSNPVNDVVMSCAYICEEINKCDLCRDSMPGGHGKSHTLMLSDWLRPTSVE